MSGFAVRDIKAICITEKEIILPSGETRNFIMRATKRIAARADFEAIERFNFCRSRDLIELRRIKINGLRRARSTGGAGEAYADLTRKAVRFSALA